MYENKRSAITQLSTNVRCLDTFIHWIHIFYLLFGLILSILVICNLTQTRIDLNKHFLPRITKIHYILTNLTETSTNNDHRLHKKILKVKLQINKMISEK